MPASMLRCYYNVESRIHEGEYTLLLRYIIEFISISCDKYSSVCCNCDMHL